MSNKTQGHGNSNIEPWLFDIIDKIANYHSKREFSYLDRDDLRQEIWEICLDRISEFRESSGNSHLTKEQKVEHYLRAVVSRRLINRFKKITRTVRFPCPKCEFYSHSAPGECEAFGENKYPCSKWRNYHISVQSREALMNTSSPVYEQQDRSPTVDSAMVNEVLTLISGNLNEQFRYDFNQFISGGHLSPQRLNNLEKEMRGAYSRATNQVDLTIGVSDAI